MDFAYYLGFLCCQNYQKGSQLGGLETGRIQGEQGGSINKGDTIHRLCLLWLIDKETECGVASFRSRC